VTPLPVCFVLPDLGGGGAQRVILELAGGLDPARFAVTLVVIGGSETLADQVPPAVQVVRLGAGRVRQGIPQLVRCLRRLEPAVIVSVMGYLNLTLLALRPLLKGRPRIVVREANVVAATLRELPFGSLAPWLYRILYPRADAIVSPVPTIATEIASAAPGAASRTVVVRNPVNEAQLRRRATPPKRPPGDGLLLLGAGRLTRQKGFDRLIDLVPLLPRETRLTIYGEGPDRAGLQQRIAELGLGERVKLENFSATLPAAMAGADLFVLPSRWEGLPNVVLEALAVGTPVIASDEAEVEDVARAAPPEAVTIAAVGPAFTDAIRNRMPVASALAEPRPSLLPAAYRREAVVADFADLLVRTATQGR
jgi:glycosyltransferase involved in cell wall biosynthesis